MMAQLTRLDIESETLLQWGHPRTSMVKEMNGFYATQEPVESYCCLWIYAKEVCGRGCEENNSCYIATC